MFYRILSQENGKIAENLNNVPEQLIEEKMRDLNKFKFLFVASLTLEMKNNQVQLLLIDKICIY